MLYSVIGKCLSVFGATWPRESTFSNELRWAMRVKYTLDFKDWVPRMSVNFLIKHF